MSLKLTPDRITLDPGQPYIWVRTEGSVGRELELRMTRAQLAARGLVRVRTGSLLSTIRKNNGLNAQGIYTDVIAGGGRVNYTMFEHDGTVPHRITARRRKMLRYIQNGRVIFRRSVWHPGTRGTHFLINALPAAGG